ncbi:unnamed protein product [Rotaria sp. Silwood1]|nr:unnamed protein product [Rotaria sp. Silwood1]
MGDNLGELSVGTTTVLPVHRTPISLAQYPSTSPYEYDCISNDNIKYETRSNNALTIPAVQTYLVSNELSPSSSFCVNALSDDIQQTPISNPNPKMTHLLYLCQTLE